MRAAAPSLAVRPGLARSSSVPQAAAMIEKATSSAVSWCLIGVGTVRLAAVAVMDLNR
jgi:hypothetical protein